MRYCSKCKLSKPFSEFTKDKKGRDGLYCQCKDCVKQTSQVYYIKSKDRIYQYQQSRKEYIKISNKFAKIYKAYGLTKEQYLKLLETQNNLCAINGCQNRLDISSKKTHVDHDHQTGKVRGLICHNCNVTLGLVKDNSTILNGLIQYLERMRSN